MRVLFVITNMEGFYKESYSLGLSILASIVRQKGYECAIHVVNSLEDRTCLLDVIGRTKPRVIGFSSTSSQFEVVKQLSKEIKDRYQTDVIQICGGVHPTIFPEAIVEAEALDGIFIGEAEYAFLDFLDKVKLGQHYMDVKNFAYSDNGTLVKNDLYPLIEDLDELPFPERHSFGTTCQLLNLKEKSAAFLFTRGCPYQCTFCANHAIAKAYGMKGFKARHRSPENCIKEVKEVVDKYGIQIVRIMDDTFGLSKAWTREFCEKYSSEIGVPFGVLLRVNLVNRELMELLKKAGCVHVYSGVESGNDFIRNDVMKRNMTREDIINAFSLYHEYGTRCSSSFVIGVPQDTEETIWDSVNLNRILRPTKTRANIFFPYKGTVLGDYCFNEGLVDYAAIADLQTERRSSALKFSPEFNEQLVYFQRNWSVLSNRLGRCKAFLVNYLPRTAKLIKEGKKMARSLANRC